MDDPRNAKTNKTIKKSKLVTLCSTTDNDGFGPLFNPFTYTGASKSKKTSVELSFPSYRENFMFYEHFSGVHLELPTMLSFMYLGRNAQGAVNYNFNEYKSVEIVDFSMELKSISLIFQIVHQLPKCREVRIFLDDNNVRPTEEEAKLDDENYTKFPCISPSVKVLKVVRSTETKNPTNYNVEDTRFISILHYAACFLPNLEFLVVEGMDGEGRTYDAINYFCKNKPLPRHTIVTKNGGRTYCEPQHNQSSVNAGARQGKDQDHTTSPPVNARNVATPVLHNNWRGSETKLNTDPRLSTRRGVMSEIKMRIPSLEPEIVELPVPSKVVPVVDISDEEEESSALKRVKTEREDPVTRPVKTVSPASTVSLGISLPWMPNGMDASSSLQNKLTVNNDWENESDEEGEKPVCPAYPNYPVPKSELSERSNFELNSQAIHSVVANVDFDAEKLRKILEAAKKDVTTKRTSNSKSSKKRRERIHVPGLDYERL